MLVGLTAYSARQTEGVVAHGVNTFLAPCGGSADHIKRCSWERMAHAGPCPAGYGNISMAKYDGRPSAQDPAVLSSIAIDAGGPESFGLSQIFSPFFLNALVKSAL